MAEMGTDIFCINIYHSREYFLDVNAFQRNELNKKCAELAGPLSASPKIWRTSGRPRYFCVPAPANVVSPYKTLFRVERGVAFFLVSVVAF